MQKTSNTPENKIKFASSYYGQQVFKYAGNIEPTKVFELSILGKFGQIHNGFLELTSLDNMTDEDANNFRIIQGYLNAGIPTSIEFRFNQGFFECNIIFDNYNYQKFSTVNSRGLDYLRSKGYLVPWNDLSINDLIEYKWAKHKLLTKDEQLKSFEKLSEAAKVVLLSTKKIDNAIIGTFKLRDKTLNVTKEDIQKIKAPIEPINFINLMNSLHNESKRYVLVGKNKINFDKIHWFKMYSKDDDRIVGIAGNFAFATYPYTVDGLKIGAKETVKDYLIRTKTKEYKSKCFNPLLENKSQEYLNSFIFRPLSNSFVTKTDLVSI